MRVPNIQEEVSGRHLTCCVPARGHGQLHMEPDDLLLSYSVNPCCCMLTLWPHHVALLPYIVLMCCTAHDRQISRDRTAPCRTPSRQPQSSWRTVLQPKSRSSSARSHQPRTQTTSSGRRTLSSPAQQRMAYPQPHSRCFCQHRGPGLLLRSVQAPPMSHRLQPRAARSRPRVPRGRLAAPLPPRRGDSSTRRPQKPCASSSAAPDRCRWRSISSSAARRSTRKTASASSARCVMFRAVRRMQAVHIMHVESMQYELHGDTCWQSWCTSYMVHSALENQCLHSI